MNSIWWEQKKNSKSDHLNGSKGEILSPSFSSEALILGVVVSFAVTSGYVHSIPESFSCRNDKEKEQVVYIHPTSWPSGWPRGFGELNPSPHSWIFTSLSVDSSPRCSYLFTSTTVPDTCSHCTKVWHRAFPIRDTPLSRSAWRSFAPLQKSRRNRRS